MEFFIQASDPRPANSVNPEDSSLGEAIETIFPLHTDFALLVWNDVYVPLTYKYDISILIADILRMLASLVSSVDGSIALAWPSSTFRTDWKLSWKSDELHITSSWESVLGGTEELLNKSPTLHIKKPKFLSMWVPLLCKVRESIVRSSGNLDTTSLLAELDITLSKLPSS